MSVAKTHISFFNCIVALVIMFAVGCKTTSEPNYYEKNDTSTSADSATSMPADSSRADTMNKFLGNIAHNPTNIAAGFSNYWNQITPENAGKWQSLEPTEGNWNWGPLDSVYHYAQDHKFPFKQHTFVWGKQEPGWISQKSESEQLQALKYFIKTFFKRYPDTELVDVVNEALHHPPSYKEALGGNGKTGWDWVIKAFMIAKKYNNGAKLLINDYGIINSPNSAQKYRKIIDLLNEQNLIDGIGIQCHAFNMDNVSKKTMKEVLDILAGSGLPVYITELDMRGSDSMQRNRYAEKFPVFWLHPSVAGITLWGYREGEIWQEGAYLLRSDGSERPALKWLKSYTKSSSTRLPVRF